MPNLSAAVARPLQKEKPMPYDEVMDKFKHGKLHSGAKDGPVVKKRDQAVAIMLDEKRKAAEGKKEYQPAHGASSMGERMARLAKGKK
jgi:hypothetical protein